MPKSRPLTKKQDEMGVMCIQPREQTEKAPGESRKPLTGGPYGAAHEYPYAVPGPPSFQRSIPTIPNEHAYLISITPSSTGFPNHL
jgi:hypothetical protein